MKAIDNLLNIIRNNTKTAILLNEPLSNHSTIKIGGPSQAIVIPETIKDLTYIIRALNKSNLKFIVTGNGSNILFPDSGIDDVIIKMASKISKIDIMGDEVVCDSRTLLWNLLKLLEKNGLSGLEFTAGVPATLGGAVISNLGAFTTEIGSLVSMVEGINHLGETKTIYRKELQFDYRKSNIAEKNLIITKVVLKLKKDDPKAIKKRIINMLSERKTKQPLNKPSIGSIFKNTKEQPAGYLIEQTGLKGLKIGRAQISNVHANIIINLGNAKSSDVIALMNKAKDEVLARFGIVLAPEIKIL